MARNVFVPVTLKVDSDGRIRPVDITWTDGHTYEIDRVKDVRQAAASKVGGTGIRYTIMVHGKETHIYCDEGKWFVEAYQ